VSSEKIMPEGTRFDSWADDGQVAYCYVPEQRDVHLTIDLVAWGLGPDGHIIGLTRSTEDSDTLKAIPDEVNDGVHYPARFHRYGNRFVEGP
jgi:6-phosphogluconolactonase/glucosamine-6-phosphate isomerase/deaminase